MSTYERVGVIPDTFAVMLRWTKARDSEAAQRLHALPFIAPEVIRRVLEDAVVTGRFDAIAQEVAAQHKA